MDGRTGGWAGYIILLSVSVSVCLHFERERDTDRYMERYIHSLRTRNKGLETAYLSSHMSCSLFIFQMSFTFQRECAESCFNTS